MNLTRLPHREHPAPRTTSFARRPFFTPGIGTSVRWRISTLTTTGTCGSSMP
jgi:hypothetical protein